MMKLDGIAAFAAVAESGSISAAAIRMALSKSVVSDRLAELERALGTRLLQRTTRRLSLTEDGAAFLVRAQRMLRETEAAMAELAERRGTLAGPLRLSAPVSFGTLHLGPALYPFLAAHPGIELALELEDRFVDVAADGYDAVLRHGPIRDDRPVARRLAASRRLLVAAPAHLARHGAPGSLPELGQGRAILYANRGNDWTFAGPEGRWSCVRAPRCGSTTASSCAMRRWPAWGSPCCPPSSSMTRCTTAACRRSMSATRPRGRHLPAHPGSAARRPSSMPSSPACAGPSATRPTGTCCPRPDARTLRLTSKATGPADAAVLSNKTEIRPGVGKSWSPREN